MKKFGLTLVTCKRVPRIRLTALSCSQKYTIVNTKDDGSLTQHRDGLGCGRSADLMVHGQCVKCPAGKRRAKLFSAEQLKRPGRKVSRGRHNKPRVHARVRVQARILGRKGEFTQTGIWRAMGGKDNKSTVSQSIHRLMLGKEVRKVRTKNFQHFYVWIGD